MSSLGKPRCDAHNLALKSLEVLPYPALDVFLLKRGVKTDSTSKPQTAGCCQSAETFARFLPQRNLESEMEKMLTELGVRTGLGGLARTP